MRKEFLPYYRPLISNDDVEAVVNSMRNGWLTTGPKTKEFEAAFASISGVRNAVAVNSCTSALNLALVALGVGAGDEVIMPSLTFVAGAECVKQLGAEPVFCDIDEATLCITPATIKDRLGPKTKVVMPMHYGGQPARIQEILAITRPLGIAVLEDAAHAVGTLDGGKWPGAFSDAAAYSFYATKNITSAEGGMLLTNRDDLAEKVRVISLHGMDRDAWKRYMKGGTWKYDVIEIGYKCNLPDMNAALGLSQLKNLTKVQTRRDEIAQRYLEAIQGIPGLGALSKFAKPPNRHSWCVFAVTVDERIAGISRDNLIDELRALNIGTSVHFIPTHQFSAYRKSETPELSATERTSERMFSLPLYPSMTDEDVEDVISALSNIITAARQSTLERSARTFR